MNELVFYKLSDTPWTNQPIFTFTDKISWNPEIINNDNLTILTSPNGFRDSQVSWLMEDVIINLQKVKTSDLLNFQNVLRDNWYNLKAYYKINWQVWKNPLRFALPTIISIISRDSSKYQFSQDWNDEYTDLTLKISLINPIY